MEDSNNNNVMIWRMRLKQQEIDLTPGSDNINYIIIVLFYFMIFVMVAAIIILVVVVIILIVH